MKKDYHCSNVRGVYPGDTCPGDHREGANVLPFATDGDANNRQDRESSVRRILLRRLDDAARCVSRCGAATAAAADCGKII